MNEKYKSVLVFDHGSLVSLAIRLSQDFEKVFYYNPHSKADFTKTSELNIGDGFSEIIWVEHFWDCINKEKPELVVFTGVRDGDLQEHLRNMGIPVWGSGKAEWMEVYRWDFLEFQKKIGMLTPPSIHIKGMTNLRKELHKRKDKRWIKLDANERGNIETFPYLDEEATELSILRPLEKELGGASEYVEFIVQESLDSIKEDGADPFTIDGQFPEKTTYGFEEKDAGWIGKVIDYKDLPEGIKTINQQLSPELKKHQYRGPISSEIKETEDGSYLIDLTCRYPYPPTNCIMDNWTNMSTCMIEGASGYMIQPVYDKPFMCEIIIYSDYAKENDFKLIYPDKIAPYIKIPYSYKSKTTGSIITVPQTIGNTNVGSVISKADTAEEALKLCLDRLEQVKGHGIHYDKEGLNKYLEFL